MVVMPTAMAMVVPTAMVAMTITAKAMADATSVNCNGKRGYRNNDGDSVTAMVMTPMATGTVMATATAMTKAGTVTARTKM
jgi:hypothetical protein